MASPALVPGDIRGRGITEWTQSASSGNSLPGGQLDTAGLVSYGADGEFNEEPYFFAITGGTGKYRTAHGEVRIKDLGSAELRTSLSESFSKRRAEAKTGAA